MALFLDVILFRTNPSEAECLFVGDGSFTVLGMATIGVKVLVCVRWFYVQVSLESAFFM